ncbi:hypothetical protein CYMTET_25645 [Cymbomonas tetramitiformis]|uniref:Uncharacterized protein n=1 Tax=Cymbomonas tetramitiformis TaxID=36881 RepID=A0AAE0KYQ1_9CHLO|nr:hypothetical protein CYMTET_25645 [Cymbomonas tetramitiformis]
MEALGCSGGGAIERSGRLCSRPCRGVQRISKYAAIIQELGYLRSVKEAGMPLANHSEVCRLWCWGRAWRSWGDGAGARLGVMVLGSVPGELGVMVLGSVPASWGDGAGVRPEAGGDGARSVPSTKLGVMMLGVRAWRSWG